MSVFISKFDRVTVAVNGGKDTVQIKRKMGYGDTQRLKDEFFRIEAKNGETTQTFQLHQQNTALLKANIVAWSFIDDRGKPVSVSDENIEQLDPDSDVADLVLAAIAAQNPGKTDASEAPDPKSESGDAISTPPTITA